MPYPNTPRSGGQILADQLRIHGTELIFGVPGESYLGLLDGLLAHADTMRFITCRHEGGAANMAEAHGKLTGRPGVCAVTRGPGASHAAIGVHTAQQDSTPMILLVGQVARAALEREGFQEVNYQRMFADSAKWVGEILDPRRIPEYVNRAFCLATSGRPGPVVLSLPEDVLTEVVTVPDALCFQPVQASPGSRQMQELEQMLRQARRPLMIVGGGTWCSEAKAGIETFARTWNLPVAASYRCQDYVDNRMDQYVGHLSTGTDAALTQAIQDCDLVIAAGPRLGEITTAGFTLFTIPVPRQRLVHVHPGSEELNHIYQPALAINAGLSLFAERACVLQPRGLCPWDTWTSELRAAYRATLVPRPGSAKLDMAHVIGHLQQVLPDDAILTNGAGNYTAWLHRYFQYSRWRTQLAPTSGAMGYGVPAGVAAAIAFPDRMVVSVNGDGCFLMYGQELATAMHYRVAPIFLVINNGMYGTIRMHQERHYPAREIATALTNPDFAAFARSFGAHGEVVTTYSEFPAAFERARRAGKAALIELQVNPDDITPLLSLMQIRTNSLKAKE